MYIPEYENYHETKAHGDPDFPYNTYLCTIPLDFSEVVLHWHNEVEIIYIKKGHGRITLDFVSHEVHAGDIIIVSPGQLHAIGIDFPDAGPDAPPAGSMEYENIIFSMELLYSRYADALTAEFTEPFQTGRLLFDHFIPCEHPLHSALSACLDRCDSICRSFPRGYRLALKASLFEFFYTVFASSIDLPKETSDPQLSRMKLVLKYVEDHYSGPISIETISSVAGFSSSHFMRFFKSLTGHSFTSYLVEYRLCCAARMLSSASDSILSIAMSCGFGNLSYFNRSFKKKYKKTPAEYRREKSKS